MITSCLSFRKYTKTDRHSLPELQESTRRTTQCIRCMMPNCPSPNHSWFHYTSGQTSSVLVESILWSLIASLASLSEEMESFMQTMRNCCTSCGDTWFGPKSKSLNWIRNNDVEVTLCVLNPLWSTNSLLSGEVWTKNNANNLTDCIQGSTIHPSNTGNCWRLYLLSESTYSSTCWMVRNTPG